MTPQWIAIIAIFFGVFCLVKPSRKCNGAAFGGSVAIGTLFMVFFVGGYARLTTHRSMPGHVTTCAECNMPTRAKARHVASAKPARPAKASAPTFAEAAPAPVSPPAPEAPHPAEPPVTVVQVAATVASDEKTEVAVASPTAAPRPSWVDSNGQLVGSVYQMSVKSGLYLDVPECQRELELAMKKAADDYIDQRLGAGTSEELALSRQYIRDHFVKAQFGEVVLTESVGPMQQIHALLEFDNNNSDRDLRALLHAAKVHDRLLMTAAATGGVLVVLSVLYGSLRLSSKKNGSEPARA